MAFTPQDLGLPYATYRPGQFEQATVLAASDERFILDCEPTGAGKSLTMFTVAKLLGARMLYLTATKGLQRQLMRDFQSSGLFDIRGQDNYECVAVRPEGALEEYGTGYSKDWTSCNDAPCKSGVQCPLRNDGCTYFDAVRAANDSQSVSSNFAYWMSLGRYAAKAHPLGKFDLLVIDEAHELPHTLGGFCKLSFHKKDTYTYIESWPESEQSDDWVTWAKCMLPVLEAYVKTMVRGSTRMKKARNLINDLTMLADSTDTHWYCEDAQNHYHLTPVWAREFAERFIYQDVSKVLLTSATLPESVTYPLNLTSYDYFDAVSNFDHTRRPLIYVDKLPSIQLRQPTSEDEFKVLVARVDEIVASSRNVRGIIHTRSYLRARQIVELSRQSDAMITHTSNNRDEVVSEFKAGKGPNWLVSPAVEKGYDFPYDECRCQIIFKVPFVFGKDPLTKLRVKTMAEYTYSIMALDLTQTAGRGMRHEDDWCETYILDAKWKFVRLKYSGLFPRWFRRTWTTLSEYKKRALASQVY